MRVKPGGWPAILIAYAFGPLANVALLDFIPMGGQLERHLGASSEQHAWLISLFGLPALFLSLVSGNIIDRIGARSVLLVGGALVTVANLAYSVADSIALFQLIRLVEGVGILCAFIAGPAFLMNCTEGKRRIAAMTLWSTYTPLGSLIGLSLGGAFADGEHWRGLFLCTAGLIFAATVAGLLLPSTPPAPARARYSLRTALGEVAAGLRDSGPLKLSGVQLLLAFVGLGGTTVIPAYLARQHGISMAAASSLVATANLAMLAGAFAGGALLARGARAALLYAGLAVCACAAAFVIYLPTAPLSAIGAALFVWYAATGAGMTTIMASLPRVAHPERRGAATALISEGSAIASLFGPPIWFAVSGQPAWAPLPLLVLAAFAVGTLLFWSLRLPPEARSAQTRGAAHAGATGG